MVVIQEVEHAHFHRQDNDIHYELTISYPDAALGGEVTVPTLTGSAALTIQPGTQPGTVLRMRDKGIPELNSQYRGDQLVHVNVFVPTKLSTREKELLRELSEGENIAPRKTKKGSRDTSFFGKVKDAFS